MDIKPEEIKQVLLTMKPRTKMFNTVKETLKTTGRWKNLPRGKNARRTKW